MLYREANTCICTNFNEDYFRLHSHLYLKGQDVYSRNGPTRELLSFKTTITQPTQRCIGGYGRNMNVFFLLAEALWIFAGRRDVKFLDIFNSNMKQYSDNGVNFHAPYGWRIRKANVDSNIDCKDEVVENLGLDQLKVALNMLDYNSHDRRVVVSIWNPLFDLAKQGADLPCNDLLMFVIRQNEQGKPALFLDIANRSNDLNLGLTTNVFQFSFLLEIMARILGVEVGHQTHNSRSLHIYMQHETTDYLQKNLMSDLAGKNYPINLYHDATNLLMDFNFHDADILDGVEGQLNVVDIHIKNMISALLSQNQTPETLDKENGTLLEEDLEQFSKYLHMVFMLLKIYVSYKKHKNKLTALNHLMMLPRVFKHISEENDLYVMALNFFLVRVKKDYSYSDFEDFKASLFVKPNGFHQPGVKVIINHLGNY